MGTESSRAAVRRDRGTGQGRRPGRAWRAADRRSDGRARRVLRRPLRGRGARSRSRSSTCSPRRPAPAAAGPGRRGEEQVPLRPRRAALVRRRRPRDGRGGTASRGQGGAQAGRGARGGRAGCGRGPNRRKNAAYVRQGEWFFLPAPDLDVDEAGAAQRAAAPGPAASRTGRARYRTGGETVYVCSPHPSGVTEARTGRLPADAAAKRRLARDAARPRGVRGARSGTPTTRRSCCTAGTGS